MNVLKRSYYFLIREKFNLKVIISITFMLVIVLTGYLINYNFKQIYQIETSRYQPIIYIERDNEKIALLKDKELINNAWRESMITVKELKYIQSNLSHYHVNYLIEYALNDEVENPRYYFKPYPNDIKQWNSEYPQITKRIIDKDANRIQIVVPSQFENPDLNEMNINGIPYPVQVIGTYSQSYSLTGIDTIYILEDQYEKIEMNDDLLVVSIKIAVDSHLEKELTIKVNQLIDREYTRVFNRHDEFIKSAGPLRMLNSITENLTRFMIIALILFINVVLALQMAYKKMIYGIYMSMGTQKHKIIIEEFIIVLTYILISFILSLFLSLFLSNFIIKQSLPVSSGYINPFIEPLFYYETMYQMSHVSLNVTVIFQMLVLNILIALFSTLASIYRIIKMNPVDILKK